MLGATQEAARVTPSIIFMPHLQNWLRQGYEQLRTVLLGALEALPLSVLLLVTSDVPRGQLQLRRKKRLVQKC